MTIAPSFSLSFTGDAYLVALCFVLGASCAAMAMASSRLQHETQARMVAIEAEARNLKKRADRFQELHSQQIAINNLQVRINKELSRK